MNTKKTLIVFFIIILLLILFLLFTLGFSLSKYISNKNSISTSEIATPILIVEGDTKIDLKEINVEKEYAFSIKNFNDTKVNETILNYQLEIISDLDMLEYKLYDKNMNEINLINNKSEEIALPINDKVEHNYILKFKVNADLKNRDIIGKVQIAVNAYQAE